METSCLTCPIFDQWQQVTSGYADTVILTLSPYAMPFLSAVLALFWTLRIARYIGGAELDIADVGKEIVMTTIASTFLTFPSMWAGLVETFLHTSVELARFLVDPDQGAISPGMSGLLSIMDRPVNQIILGGRALMAGAGFTELGLLLGALLLVGVYGLLLFFVLIDVIWVFTKFIFLKVLGPLFFVALAVPATRGTAVQAYKIALTGLCQFASIGIIVGLANYMLKLAQDHMPLTADGEVTGDASAYLFGADYITALFCGLVLIFLRTAFNHLASQLANAVTDSAPSLSAAGRAASEAVKSVFNKSPKK